MTDIQHFVEPWIDTDAMYLSFTCKAPVGAPCLMRHPNPDVEAWSIDDPELVPTKTCNIVDWLDELGAEGYAGSHQLLHAGPIETGWTGDGYEWWYPGDPEVNR